MKKLFFALLITIIGLAPALAAAQAGGGGAGAVGEGARGGAGSGAGGAAGSGCGSGSDSAGGAAGTGSTGTSGTSGSTDAAPGTGGTSTGATGTGVGTGAGAGATGTGVGTGGTSGDGSTTGSAPSTPSGAPSASPQMGGSQHTTERECLSAGGTWQTTMCRLRDWTVDSSKRGQRSGSTRSLTPRPPTRIGAAGMRERQDGPTHAERIGGDDNVPQQRHVHSLGDAHRGDDRPRDSGTSQLT
jgi:hypothetical protein